MITGQIDGKQELAIRMFHAGNLPSEIMRALGVPQEEFYPWFGQLMQSGALDAPPTFHNGAQRHNGQELAAPVAPQEANGIPPQVEALTATMAQFQKSLADASIEQLATIRGTLHHLQRQGDERYEVLAAALGKILARLQGEVPVSVLRRVFGRGVAAGVILAGLGLGIPFALEPDQTVNTAYAVWMMGDQMVMWFIGLF
jgi:hypothetical protein